MLRSIGIGMSRLARRTGGIACRKEGDTFLLYCPHQENYEPLFDRFMADLFVDEETADKVSLRFGICSEAQLEPEIEMRFSRAKAAADRAVSGSSKKYRIGFTPALGQGPDDAHASSAAEAAYEDGES